MLNSGHELKMGTKLSWCGDDGDDGLVYDDSYNFQSYSAGKCVEEK